MFPTSDLVFLDGLGRVICSNIFGTKTNTLNRKEYRLVWGNKQKMTLATAKRLKLSTLHCPHELLV